MSERDLSLEARRLQREERMRYEVLRMLYDVSGADCSAPVRAWNFALDLGVWHAELFRVIEFLARHGYVDYLGAGPVVRITRKGCDYVEGGAGKRKSIRETG